MCSLFLPQNIFYKRKLAPVLHISLANQNVKRALLFSGQNFVVFAFNIVAVLLIPCNLQAAFDSHNISNAFALL